MVNVVYGVPDPSWGEGVSGVQGSGVQGSRGVSQDPSSTWTSGSQGSGFQGSSDLGSGFQGYGVQGSGIQGSGGEGDDMRAARELQRRLAGVSQQEGGSVGSGGSGGMGESPGSGGGRPRASWNQELFSELRLFDGGLGDRSPLGRGPSSSQPGPYG